MLRLYSKQSNKKHDNCIREPDAGLRAYEYDHTTGEMPVFLAKFFCCNSRQVSTAAAVLTNTQSRPARSHHHT